MRKFLLLQWFLFSSILICNAQLISQQFVSEITYTQNGRVQKYYISDGNSPMMTVEFYPKEKNLDPIYYLIVPQISLNAILSGNLYLGKYFEIMSWAKYETEMHSGGKNYEIKSDNISYQNYSNCRLIAAQTDDNEMVEMYFTKAGSDKIDYSPSANYALRQQGMPEILNFDDVLGKGWVLVYGHIIINDQAIAFTYDTLKSVNDTPSEVIISEQDIPENFKKSIAIAEAEDYPMYCNVYSLDTKTDKKIDEQVYNFTLGACKFYELFGRYNHTDFNKYYDEDTENHIKYIRTEKLLSEKQIIILRKALLELRLQNPK